MTGRSNKYIRAIRESPLPYIFFGLLIVIGGCAHRQRMAEVNLFESGYFQLITGAAYADAYELLDPEVKGRVTPEQYAAFFGTLIDALGEVTGWEKLPGANDQPIPLLERENRRDPLPPDDPKAALQSRYSMKFAGGTVTFLVRTGWDGARLAVRGQQLCCLEQKTIEAIRESAQKRGTTDLFKPPEPPAKPAPVSPR